MKKITYIDGEAESYKWCALDEFKAITESPEENNLINQGKLYFGSLINSIEYVSLGKNILI